MRKRMLAGLLLGMMMVVMAGCGSSEKTTFQRIKDTKEMTFAMTGAYPPFNFINENGDLVGFDIDIANAIAEKMDVKAKPITTTWDGIISGLTGKRFDMIIGSMAVTEERQQKVSFTDPYYLDGAQFFAKPDSGFKDISELKGGSVGVVTGTTFHTYLSKLNNVTEILQFDSDVDNMKSVEIGRADGLVTGKLVGLYSAKQYNVAIEPIGEPLYQETIAIAIRQEDKDLVIAVNKALQEMKEDGTYEKISKKWFGRNIL